MFGDKVHLGPFRGMTMLPPDDGTISAFVPRLLGFYEQELHPHVEAAIARGYGAIVNVGCAEGYYAVGLARRLPETRHFAFDIAPQAQAMCRQAATTNEVLDRLEIAGECDHAAMSRIIGQHASALLVVDCEGAEGKLLNPAACPALRQADIIVECHEFIVPGITDLLTRRFADSHDIVRVEEGGRNPMELDFAQHYSNIDRWLMVMEDRPRLMWWLILTARRDS
jgi:hypothetical protein